MYVFVLFLNEIFKKQTEMKKKLQFSYKISLISKCYLILCIILIIEEFVLIFYDKLFALTMSILLNKKRLNSNI